MGTVMHASVEKSCIWRRCLQKNRKFLISKKNCRMKKKFIFSCSCVDEPLDWIIIILKCTKLNQWIRSGLDYSDVIFASAKFRAAAKIEKTSTATCLFLVKNLGNFTKKREIYVWAFSNKYYIPSWSCPQKSFKQMFCTLPSPLRLSPNSLFLEDAVKTGFI